MKKVLHIAFSAGLLLILSNCKNGKEDNNSSAASEKEGKVCNYINDYYQTVYQAEIAYLKQEYQTAFDLLKEAESRCQLLNQSIIYETQMLAELYVRLDKPEGAFPYLYQLLRQGYSFSRIENDTILGTLNGTAEWKKLKADAPAIETKFQKGINVKLRHEIIAMQAEDQRVRQGNIDWTLLEKTDSIHEERMKEILIRFGYPNPKLVGKGYFQEQPTEISAMLMHFNDTTWFKSKLTELLRKGKAPAGILAYMIDSRRRNTGKYLYGIYRDTDSSEIKNFEELDLRRLNVDLRPWEMQQEYWKLKGL